MGQAELGRLFVAEVVGNEADPAANHAAVGDDVVHHPAHQVDRDGKADALDAEFLATIAVLMPTSSPLGVDQRATGVAEVDRARRSG